MTNRRTVDKYFVKKKKKIIAINSVKREFDRFCRSELHQINTDNSLSNGARGREWK